MPHVEPYDDPAISGPSGCIVQVALNKAWQKR